MLAKDKEPKPKWLIDLPGIVEALRSRSNARAKVIDAIEAGEMLIKKNVSSKLKDSYPDLYDDFKAIKKKKYVAPLVRDDALAANLQESYSGSVGSGIPSYEQFQNVALARRLKCKLVSASNALKRCEAISQACGYGNDAVVAITAV